MESLPAKKANKIAEDDVESQHLRKNVKAC